ncbi:hypothetical protein PDIDSM_1021 [Penicillium digitatum]|nr:hypothetical protein PDIDSM_1021 [Penicillium digitatum]
MTVPETPNKSVRTFEPFYLTCLDHTVGPVFMNFFLSFRKNTEECLIAINQGVSGLVERLPILAGDVIQTTSPDGRMNVMQIVPSSTLIHEVPMDREVCISGRYVPPVSLLPISPGPRPVFRLRSNVLADGLVLAVGFHHSVFDATGAGRLIEKLAERCRDPGSQNLTPTSELKEEIYLRRLVDDAGMLTARSSCRDKEESQDCKIEAPTAESDWVMPKLDVYSFHFAAATIAQLKTACSGGLSDLQSRQHDDDVRPVDDSRNPKQKFISTNDILTALVALDMYKARTHQMKDAQTDKTAEMVMIVDLRKRFASLPSTYLGNSVSIIRANAHPHSVLPKPAVSISKRHQHPTIANAALLEITALALQIRQKLALIDDPSVRRDLARLMRKQDWSQMGTHLPNMMVSSWRQLKVYGLDFGPALGQIVEFNPQATLVDGFCIIQPERASESGEKSGWEAYVTLQSDAMGSSFQNGTFSTLSQDKVARYVS